jgi:hypothetical protein
LLCKCVFDLANLVNLSNKVHAAVSFLRL